MGGAVEMCSGLGACRKQTEGTMCPSYMATREEGDVTRGRANVLRLAMNGKLGDLDRSLDSAERDNLSDHGQVLPVPFHPRRCHW